MIEIKRTTEHPIAEESRKPSHGMAKHIRREKAAGRGRELPRSVVSEKDIMLGKIKQLQERIESDGIDERDKVASEMELIWWRQKAGEITPKDRIDRLNAIQEHFSHWSYVGNWLREIDDTGMSRATKIMQRVYPPQADQPRRK